MSGGRESEIGKRLVYATCAGTLVSALALWLVGAALSAPVNSPVERIGEVAAPILLVAGSEDRHTAIEESKASARSQKEFWVVNPLGRRD